MAVRIDNLRITGTFFADFIGYYGIDFCLPLPIDPEDPLVVMIRERHQQLRNARALAEGTPTGTGGMG